MDDDRERLRLAQGIEFIDLHACNDWGGDGGNGQSMPLHRGHLERRAGLVQAIKLVTNGRSASDAATGHPVTTELMEPLGGVMAWRITAGAKQICSGPSRRDSAGQWFVVLGGTAKLDRVQFGPALGFFVAGDEPAPTFTAGAAGLDMVVLQFSGLPDARSLRPTRAVHS